jgi:hypothetical protein
MILRQRMEKILEMLMLEFAYFYGFFQPPLAIHEINNIIFNAESFREKL